MLSLKFGLKPFLKNIYFLAEWVFCKPIKLLSKLNIFDKII